MKTKYRTILCLLFALALVSTSKATNAQANATLEDIFAEPGDILNRTFDEFVPERIEQLLVYPHELPVHSFDHDASRIRRIAYAIKGPTFRTYPSGVPREPEYLEEFTETQIVVLFLPERIRFDKMNSALLLVHRYALPVIDGETNKFVKVAVKLAQMGIPVALQIPDPRNGGQGTFVENFGYSVGELNMNGLYDVRASLDPNDPNDLLTVEDLRLDFRYALAQSRILTATFFQDYIRLDPDDLYPESTSTERTFWADNLRTVHSGGSKGGSGAMTAAGADPRCVGVRVAGNQGWDGGPMGGYARYMTDWLYTPLPPTPSNGETAYPENPFAPFAQWAFETQDMPSSYMSVYVPSHNPDRYKHLLILDLVGTHDWIFPGGASSDFFGERDGLRGLRYPSFIADGEEIWDVRHIRRINKDHAVGYVAGHQLNNAGDHLTYTADDLLFMNAMVKLRYPNQTGLPRLDVADIQTLVSGHIHDTWVAIIRIDGNSGVPFLSPHERSESLTIWVLASDDRDLRRCGGPIERNQGQPCELHDSPYDGGTFLNHNDEDVFRKAQITQVERVDEFGTPDDGGSFRKIQFELPADFSVFDDPQLAFVAEARLDGPFEDKIVDDLIVHSRVVIRNEQ